MGQAGVVAEKENKIEITPEMLKAGAAILSNFEGGHEQFTDLARLVFCVMGNLSGHPALRGLELEIPWCPEYLLGGLESPQPARRSR